MAAGGATEQVSSVLGELQYLSPQSTVLRRFTAPGASVNTGSYESHAVPIRNGRPVQDSFRLDTHGFEIVRHRSAIRDFTDKAEVEAVYIPEVVEFVKDRTGADEVASRGAVLRRSADPAANASQPQAALVHIDYGPEGAAMTAPRVYAEAFPDGTGYRRALATSYLASVQPAAAGLAARAVRLSQRPRRRGTAQPAVLRRPGPRRSVRAGR